MKLTSFNCTIELSKDENGYSNNCYIDVTDNGVTISHPYDTQTPEQAMFVTNLIHDFIDQAIAFNNRIDGFNSYNQLEPYASQAPSTGVSSSESTDVSAVPQPSHGTCSNNQANTDLVAHSEAEQERLDMEEELYKEAE